MQRPPLLLALVVVAATVARTLERPLYAGAPDAERCRSSFGISWPFGDDLKGACDAFLSLHARSLVREGVAATGGIPLYNPDHVEPRAFFYYNHHPSGIALLTALAFRLFGESEGVARGVALLFSTLTLVLVGAFVRRRAGDGAAAIAVVAIVSAPIGLYWSTHLDFFVPTIAACAAFLSLALRDAPTRRTHLLAGAALVAAMAFDLLALLAPVAAAIVLLPRRPRRWGAIVGWPALAGACAWGWSAWSAHQLARWGHDDFVRGIDNILLVWRLPDGVGWLDLLRAVEGHLRALVTPLGEATIAAGLLLSLRRGASGELERFLRASTLLALGAGLLPRVRALDHPYFQLYWILPLGASAALVATNAKAQLRWHAPPAGDPPTASRRPSLDVVLGLLLVAAFLLVGWRARPRWTPDPAFPSTALLGRELAAAPVEVRAIALPAEAHCNDYVPLWYARRLVLRLPAGPKTGPEKLNAISGWLTLFGIGSDEPVWEAKDPQWPGRGGMEPLKPDDPPPPPPK